MIDLTTQVMPYFRPREPDPAEIDDWRPLATIEADEEEARRCRSEELADFARLYREATDRLSAELDKAYDLEDSDELIRRLTEAADTYNARCQELYAAIPEGKMLRRRVTAIPRSGETGRVLPCFVFVNYLAPVSPPTTRRTTR